jgi:hypothetical protein
MGSELDHLLRVRGRVWGSVRRWVPAAGRTRQVLEGWIDPLGSAQGNGRTREELPEVGESIAFGGIAFELTTWLSRVGETIAGRIERKPIETCRFAQQMAGKALQVVPVVGWNCDRGMDRGFAVLPSQQ